MIEARKESFGPASYTSASLITRRRAEFRYGRIEVRAQLPLGRGMWPAIWTLGTNIDSVGWPSCGEIDIMENVGFEPDRVHGNIHTGAYNHVNGKGKGAFLDVPGIHEGFHRYAVEWTASRIDFFVDDRAYFTFNKESGDPQVWPFDLPQLPDPERGGGRGLGRAARHRRRDLPAAYARGLRAGLRASLTKATYL